MGLFDFLFGKKKMTLETADKINDKYTAQNPVAVDSENELMRKAAKSMSSGNFTEAIDLYTELAGKYPQKKGLYEGQVGAAYYFLGDYAKAIESYTSALNNGGDKSMMDDNIWEATEAIYGQTKDKKAVEEYVALFPNGSYKKKAEKLLQG
jgi:tetratricopeptide (TPR) repeat protein